MAFNIFLTIHSLRTTMKIEVPSNSVWTVKSAARKLRESGYEVDDCGTFLKTSAREE